jgi:hypothetical protein
VELRLRHGSPGKLDVDVRSDGLVDFTFNRRAFTRIVMRGGRGNDAFSVRDVHGNFFRSERTTLDGGPGSDGLSIAGSPRADRFAVTADRCRLRVVRGSARYGTSGGFPLIARSIEHLSADVLRGPDVVTVGDLSATKLVDLWLALGPLDENDGQPDAVTLAGSNRDDSILLGGRPGVMHVKGLLPRIVIVATEASDRLTVNALAGDDTIDASAVRAGAMMLTLEGGPGTDVIDPGPSDVVRP